MTPSVNPPGQPDPIVELCRVQALIQHALALIDGPQDAGILSLSCLLLPMGPEHQQQKDENTS